MMFESQIVLDFIGGADAGRTRDLLNAMTSQGQSTLLPSTIALIAWLHRALPS